jgi:hypothetical protein
MYNPLSSKFFNIVCPSAPITRKCFPFRFPEPFYFLFSRCCYISCRSSHYWLCYSKNENGVIFVILSTKFWKILPDKDCLGEKEQDCPVNPKWHWEIEDFATANCLQIFENADTKNSTLEFPVFFAWTLNTFEVCEPLK